MNWSGHCWYPAIVLCVAPFLSLSPAVREIEEEVGIEKCSMSVRSDSVHTILFSEDQSSYKAVSAMPCCLMPLFSECPI